MQEISGIADGINHAVPSQKELRISLDWLIKNGLVNKTHGKFDLTKKGGAEYISSSLGTNAVMDTWLNLEISLFKKNML